MSYNMIEPVRLLYYIDRQGRAPFIRWLEGLKDRATRARIKVRLDRLARGHFGDTRSVGAGVEELRIDTGPGYRVYYGRLGFSLVLLLCGGTKSRQQEDIRTAKGYWADYLEASHGSKKKKGER